MFYHLAFFWFVMFMIFLVIYSAIFAFTKDILDAKQ